MRRRFSRFTRRSVMGAIVGLAFCAGAGVGLAQIVAAPPQNRVLQPTDTTGTTGTTGTTPQKVIICHHTHSKKKPFHTITVASPAVPAHLQHGDTLGPCPPTPGTTATSEATTTTSHGKKPKTKQQQRLSPSSTGGHSSSHGNSGHGHSATTHGQSHGNNGHGGGHGHGK